MAISRHPEFATVFEAAYSQFLQPSFSSGIAFAVPSNDPGTFGDRARVNIHAIGIGRKIVGGQPIPDSVALRFFVIQKIPAVMVPNEAAIPSTFEGLPTDVIATTPGRFPTSAPSSCNANWTIKESPIQAGDAINALGAGGLGAIAAFCTRPSLAGQNGLLTNWHVATRYGRQPAGAVVHPPGAYPKGIIGNVTQSSNPQPHPALPAFHDAALVDLLPGLSYSAQHRHFGWIKQPAVLPKIGQLVSKYGPSSCLTQGVVTDYPFLTAIGKNDATYVFSDQIRVASTGSSPFSLAGDSGSLVVDTGSGNPVGICFGIADDAASASFVSPLVTILHDFGVSLM